MRLYDLFRCCLPVPEKASDGVMASSGIEVDSNRKKKRSERANLSGKKLRKEDKRLKKEMVDRRKEVEMAVSEAQEGGMKALPLAERKERVGEKVEGFKNGQIIIHKAMVHASQDSQDANQLALVMNLANANGDSQKKDPQLLFYPALQEERRERLLGWFDRREAAKKKADAFCSVTGPESVYPNWSCQKQCSLNGLEEERRLQLLAWFQRRGLTVLKAAVTQAAKMDNGGPQLAEGCGQCPSQLVTDGECPVIRPRLDSKKYQLRVHQGEQRRRLTPQEKDVLEEQRRLQLLAWFQRRCLTALKAADTQAAESCTSNGSHDGDNILPQ
ncbi:hypothetical protein ACEWY4_026629 [Coilia grayii]|uniref:Uncharacterized protein n=1 Tax=Coilia grayii TaxID=363190 RepID=A0ABD1ISC9_9TELE